MKTRPAVTIDLQLNYDHHGNPPLARS